MSEENTVKRLKDFNKPTFVCQHIQMNCDLAFNVPYDIEFDRQAWCDECEKVLQEEKGWTDRAVEFAGLEEYCKYCFEELRAEKIEERQRAKTS
jgi:hypothetical protein